MRTALLPTPGDPFLTRYWLKHAESWRDRVDNLIVCISWKQEPEVIERITADAALIDAQVIAPDLIPDHGVAMKALLAEAPDGHIIYCEDDCYVRSPAAIDDIFQTLEADNYDIVGIPRGSMALPIYDAGRTHFPGPALWPCMLAAHSDRFRAIKETFGTRVWEPGETVAGIDYVIPEEYPREEVHGVNKEWCADTFGAAAMEMQVGARLWSIPELSVLGLHVPAEERVYPSMQGAYVHIGSLSSGPWPWRTGELITGDEGTMQSYSIRIGWWMRFWRTWPGGLDALHAEYGDHIQRLIDHYGAARIDKWCAISESFVSWPE